MRVEAGPAGVLGGGVLGGIMGDAGDTVVHGLMNRVGGGGGGGETRHPHRMYLARFLVFDRKDAISTKQTLPPNNVPMCRGDLRQH